MSESRASDIPSKVVVALAGMLVGWKLSVRPDWSWWTATSPLWGWWLLWSAVFVVLFVVGVLWGAAVGIGRIVRGEFKGRS